MVWAPFCFSLEGRSLVNRNRLYACRGQLERISVPFLLVTPPNRRSRLRPDLLHDPSFEKLDYRPLGLGALRTCRRSQAMIVALRCASEQYELRVVEFDGHDLNARVSGAGQSRPLTDASPGSQRLPGRRLLIAALSTCGRGLSGASAPFEASVHTLSFEPKASPLRGSTRAAFGCACGRSDGDLRRFRRMIRSASYPKPDVSPSTNGSLISRSANPTIASTRSRRLH
jgi:hypothetical protein